jgi:fibrillarin-like pre-rRNA processing protein
VRPRTRLHPDPRSERLWQRREDRRLSWFTTAVEDPPQPVYGERLLPHDAGVVRQWDPNRSKLAAALVNGFQGPVPRRDDHWLYLGAATGTTASHVADLVGPAGSVVAVERSLRPFAQLLRVAERFPNLLPIFGDARQPATYDADVAMVDGLYVDVAQPDQVEIVLANARRRLVRSGRLLLALKTASLGRSKGPREHLRDVEDRLASAFELEESVALEPFHRRHFLVAGTATRRLFLETSEESPTRRPSPRAG